MGKTMNSWEYFLLLLVGFVTIASLYGLSEAFSGDKFLIFGKDKFIPSIFTRFLYFTTLLISGMALGLFFIVKSNLKNDFQAHQTALITEATKSDERKNQEIISRVEKLESQGDNKICDDNDWWKVTLKKENYEPYKKYEFIDPQNDNRVEIAQLYSKDEWQDPESGQWFRRGTLLYEDKTLVDIKVTIIFGHQSWHKNSETKIARPGAGRKPEIENVIKQNFISETVNNSKYVACLGLASSEAASKSFSNEDLSRARALNMCRAIVNLDLKPNDKVRGVPLGEAKTKATSDRQAELQRSIIFIGIDVYGTTKSMTDIIRASADLITLDGVLIDDYSLSKPQNIDEYKDISKGRYVSAHSLPDIMPLEADEFLLEPTTECEVSKE